MFTTNNFNEALKPMFDKLGFPVFNFEFWPEISEFVSKESFENNDGITNKVIIRITENIGTVLYGGIIENEVCDEIVMGTIKHEDNKWVCISTN